MNTKQMVIAKLEGYQEEILQKGMKKLQDSFWYDGDIAYFRCRGREVLVCAVGDIRLENTKTKEVDRGDCFRLGVKNDKDLRNLEKKGWIWDENNWFEIMIKKDENRDFERFDCDIGSYDMAIQEAKRVLFDDSFWGDKNGI